MAFEIKVLRKMFEPKRDAVKEEGRKLCYEVLHNLSSSASRLFKSKEMSRPSTYHV
jgi:hypothetical protein